MEIVIVACEVFKTELEQVLPGLIKNEFPDHNIKVHYLKMLLHMDSDKLLHEVSQELRGCDDKQLIVLFGSYCSPELRALCAEHNACLPTQKNCIDIYASEAEQAKRANGQEIFFLTNGWFDNWHETLLGSGMDTIDARINYGRYDSFILLDSKQTEISDEEMFEFFDFTTVPIEVQALGLEDFTNTLRELIKQAIDS
jgi:hypothetical protein